MPLFVVVVPLLIFLAILLVVSRALNLRAGETPEPAFPPRLGWTLLIGVLALNLFAYDSVYGSGLGLFYALLIAAMFLSFTPAQRTKLAWTVAVLGIIAALAFGWRANEFVQRVNMLVVFLSLAALLVLKSVEIKAWHGPHLLTGVLHYLDRAVRHLPAYFFGLKKHQTKSSRLVIVVRTIVLTAVALLFFAWLLSNADPVFHSMIERVREQLAGRTILSVILVLLLTVGLSVRFVERTKEPAGLRMFSFWEIAVPVGAIILLFGLFLFVQGTYLFGSHEGLQAYGLTYSEYARKGFIELLVATFFASLVAYIVILKKHALSDGKELSVLTALNVVLILEIFLLLGSALQRDWIYMDTYGLTRVRIIGEIFLAWLAGVLILLLALNVWKRMRERELLGGVFALSIAVFAVLNICNMDLRIARAVPPREQPRDLFYSSLLSKDAAEEWPAMADEAAKRLDEVLATNVISDEQKLRLADAKMASLTLLTKIHDRKNYPWPDDNLSAYSAQWIVAEEGMEELLQCVLREIEQYQLLHSVELSAIEQNRLYDYEYPFVDSDFRFQAEYARSLDMIRTYMPDQIAHTPTDPDPGPNSCTR